MSGPNLEAGISPSSSPTDTSTEALAVDHVRPMTNPPVCTTAEATRRGEGPSSSVAESSTNQALHASQDGVVLEPGALPGPAPLKSQTVGEPTISESAAGSSRTAADTNRAATHTGQAAANSGERPETHSSSNRDTHGIYLRSPVLMGSSWILGVIFSLGHHLFYSHFDGSIVGSTNEQQWNIRFVFPSAYEIGSYQLTVQFRVGSFFALVVKILLMGSVWFAYTQWLWRTLKRRAISLKGLDAAFRVEMSMIALLNPELILKVRVGAVLALIAW